MNQRRRPRGGLGGRSPKKFQVGDGPCIRPPNVFRSSVVGCARKYEQGKKRCLQEDFCCEIVVSLLVKKGSFNTVKIRRIWKKKGKIREKPSRWLKKGHKNFWAWNWKFVRKNVIQKSWSAKNFPSPKLGARSPPLLWTLSPTPSAALAPRWTRN